MLNAEDSYCPELFDSNILKNIMNTALVKQKLKKQEVYVQKLGCFSFKRNQCTNKTFMGQCSNFNIILIVYFCHFVTYNNKHLSFHNFHTSKICMGD